jgi:hypothetical protein
MVGTRFLSAGRKTISAPPPGTTAHVTAADAFQSARNGGTGFIKWDGLAIPTVTLASYTDLDYGTLVAGGAPDPSGAPNVTPFYKDKIEYLVEWDNVPATAVLKMGPVTNGPSPASAVVPPGAVTSGTVLIIVDPSTGDVRDVLTLAE